MALWSSTNNFIIAKGQLFRTYCHLINWCNHQVHASFATQLRHFLAGLFSFSVSVSLLLLHGHGIHDSSSAYACHLMMTSIKPNHINHLATVCKHVNAPPTWDVAVYNPSFLRQYTSLGSQDYKPTASLVEVL